MSASHCALCYICRFCRCYSLKDGSKRRRVSVEIITLLFVGAHIHGKSRAREIERPQTIAFLFSRSHLGCRAFVQALQHRGAAAPLRPAAATRWPTTPLRGAATSRQHPAGRLYMASPICSVSSERPKGSAVVDLRRAPGRGVVRRRHKSDGRAPGRGRAI